MLYAGISVALLLIQGASLMFLWVQNRKRKEFGWLLAGLCQAASSMFDITLVLREH
jgi:hypothetical protein